MQLLKLIVRRESARHGGGLVIQRLANGTAEVNWERHGGVVAGGGVVCCMQPNRFGYALLHALICKRLLAQEWGVIVCCQLFHLRRGVVRVLCVAQVLCRDCAFVVNWGGC